MQPAFRKAVPDDALAIASLLTLAWQKAYRGILSDSLLDGINADKRSEGVRSIIEENPNFKYYVLETDGVIAGVSGLCASRDDDLPDTGEIVVFYIRPDLQKRGLGRAMMKEALAILKADGYARIALWTLRDNHPARAFYEKMGFRLDGAEKTMPNLENAATVRYQYSGKHI